MDNKYDVIYVKGVVPGPDHCYVRVMDTVLNHRRKGLMKNPPSCPTLLEDSAQKLPSEVLSSDLFDFRDDSISISAE